MQIPKEKKQTGQIIFFPHSRKHSINLAKNQYAKYLKNNINSSPEKHSSNIYKNCMYHSLFSEIFSDKTTKYILTILSTATTRSDKIENIDKAYLARASFELRKTDYSIDKDVLTKWKQSEEGNNSRALFFDYLKKMKQINTCELLKLLLFALHGNTGEKHMETYGTHLKQFLTKFETSGKLHEEYTIEFQKISDKFSLIENYALLATTLLLFYKKNKNLKFFNAILKLNDLLGVFIKEDIDCEFYPLVIFSLIAEEEEIIKLYDSKRFRLPSDR